MVDIGIAGDIIVLVTVIGPDPAVFVTVTPIGAWEEGQRASLRRTAARKTHGTHFHRRRLHGDGYNLRVGSTLSNSDD